MQTRLEFPLVLLVAFFTNFYIDKIRVKTKHIEGGYTDIAADRCTVI